ncbi:hypothetical protein WN943_021035 [Citrus x changshan-huyou]
MEVCPDITNTAQSRTYTKVECLWVVALQAAYDVFVNIYYLPIPTHFILELTGFKVAVCGVLSISSVKESVFSVKTMAKNMQ